MERLWQIEKVNLKYNIPFHVLATLLLLCLSPFLMGVKNLVPQDTAKVLEMYVALTGIIMIPSIFLPEQEKEIRDLVSSKYTGSYTVYLVRLFGNVAVLSLFLGGYIFILKYNACEFPVIKYYLGTMAEMLFLGGLGLFAYGFSDNLIIGYMLPVMFYITAIGGGKKHLGIFYPFSMIIGSYKEKVCLLIGAIILLTAALWLRCRRGGSIIFLRLKNQQF